MQMLHSKMVINQKIHKNTLFAHSKRFNKWPQRGEGEAHKYRLLKKEITLSWRKESTCIFNNYKLMNVQG